MNLRLLSGLAPSLFDSSHILRHLSQCLIPSSGYEGLDRQKVHRFVSGQSDVHFSLVDRVSVNNAFAVTWNLMIS